MEHFQRGTKLKIPTLCYLGSLHCCTTDTNLRKLPVKGENANGETTLAKEDMPEMHP